jgi:septal ring factor EnvC (AmiA/AmiB activator)
MDEQGKGRADLLARLSELLGPEHAATLMESLPPRPWSELATKDDLVPISNDIALLKTDVAVLKTDVAVLKTDVAVLTTDVAVLKTDVAVLKTDVAVLKTDVAVLKTDVAGLREDVNRRFDHFGETLELRFASQGDRLEALLRERIDAQTKLLVFSILGAVLTAAGIALGSATL